MVRGVAVHGAFFAAEDGRRGGECVNADARAEQRSQRGCAGGAEDGGVRPAAGLSRGAVLTGGIVAGLVVVGRLRALEWRWRRSIRN